MKIKQRFVRAVVYYGTRAIIFLFRLLPLSFDTWFGARLGVIAYYLMPSERNRGIRNIMKAFPDKQKKRACTQLRKSFEGFGKSVMELIKIDTIVNNIDDYISVENFNVFEQAVSKGKGIIWITGHIGNWELIPVYFAQKGYDVYVVAKAMYDARMDRLMNDLRKQYNVHPILRGSSGAGKTILRALRSNAILGMLIDQDTDVQGVFVDFFGDTAFTPRGAADLALKTSASVVAGFITRVGAHKHVIRLYGPIEVTGTSNYKQDVIDLTQAMTYAIEKHIKAHPSDWVWMHSRWAKRPPADNKL